MRGFGAKDADRDRYVELIESAYVDGQLGAADRELRVSRARAAETLDELETLARDLRAPARVVAPPPARAVGPSPARRAGGVLVGLGAFVALVGAGVTGVVALAMFAVSGAEEVTVTDEVAVGPVVPGESFAMTAPQVRLFLRAYEGQFGTLDALEAVFHPHRVDVIVARGTRPRLERWSWDGVWRQDTGASAAMGPGGTVDLGAIDVPRLFANIATARKVLGVPRGELTHVLVNRLSDGTASVTIHVANSADEGGQLRTTLGGEEIRRSPHRP